MFSVAENGFVCNMPVSLIFLPVAIRKNSSVSWYPVLERQKRRNMEIKINKTLIVMIIFLLESSFNIMLNDYFWVF